MNTFESHWAELNSDGQFTEEDKRIARLFYRWGVTDLQQSVKHSSLALRMAADEKLADLSPLRVVS